MVHWRHIEQPDAVPSYLAPPIPGELRFNPMLCTAGQIAALITSEFVAFPDQPEILKVETPTPVSSGV